MFTSVIAFVCLLIFVGFLLNKNAMGKFKTALSAFLGKGADSALNLDPIAVYREKIEQSAEELRGAVGLLENHAALIKQLKRKLEDTYGEHSLVENRVKKYMNAGDVAKAEEYALAAVKLYETLTHTKERLDATVKTYDAQTAKIKVLKDKIVEYKQKAGNMASDLEISKAEAEISTLAQKFDSSSLGFDDLKEVENAIQKQIDKNESKATVAQDLHVGHIDIQAEMADELRKNKAKELMEKFAVKEL